MSKSITPRQHFEAQLTELVDKFNRQRDRYMSPDYNETDVRVEFIDRFFEALGWDVYNAAGLGKYERDVAREVTEVSGRFDYQFQMHGRAMFIVEAKAPHVPLERTDVIMQAKKYAWNSKESSIVAVTDFEEFRLYDATLRPDPKHPDVGLIFAHKYATYLKPKVLDDLWLLSKEAVAAGSIEQLLKMSSVKQRERIPVDQSFLDDLTDWREKLAKAVYKIEPEIDLADLNSVVQVFLDRLIFIRFAEDHGILPRRELEDVARLWERSGKQRSLVNDLNALFHEVNYLLNGEIFKFHRCEKVDWDQEAALVAKIITGLYDGPYRFDVIGVELLGSIYERYLGKTIRVTATRAIVEDKPEVRKAGGVYYTPRYIVDYIVDQTVGKLIEGKSPDHIAKLKILDPACGSGSFLLGAYQKLLDYHIQWKASHQRKRGRAAPGQARLMLDDAAAYEAKLSLEEKAAILRNNIYGVDLDQQAVEITMMSLYIKMLEGERGAIMGRGILPPLRDNIKCGNSLIGHDINAPDLFGEPLSAEELDRIKPFDWDSPREGFGEIMTAGGFDAVIGNPPWGGMITDVEKTYLHSRYVNRRGEAESHLFFIERAVGLLRTIGILGFITPNTWLSVGNSKEIREHLLNNVTFHEITELSKYIFSGAPDIVPILVFLGSKVRKQDCTVKRSQETKIHAGNFPDAFIVSQIDQKLWLETTDSTINLRLSPAVTQIVAKCRQHSHRLSEIGDVLYGIKTGDNQNFLARSRTATHKAKALKTGELHRYDIQWKGYWLNWSAELAGYRTSSVEVPKIVVQYIRKISLSRRIIAALDDEGTYYPLNNYSYVITKDARYSIKYLIGVLNSTLVNFYFANTFIDYNIKPTYLQQLPIHVIDFDEPSDKAKHDRMAALVDRMLDLHKQKQAATSDATRTRLERELNITDEKIDALVYQLYGLTQDEIKVVEGKV